MQARCVYLVGAGPGRGDLLTLRAVECLQQADVVIYDRLVPVALLDHAPTHARRMAVADLAACHPPQAERLAQVMIEAARAGLCVVRLKGGDPFLFGRGGEEAEFLRAAGVPYEVIPGVTAALGAAAFAGLPLTHRQYASAVAFVTGHEDPSKGTSNLDWAALAHFPGTLVIYMGMARLAAIVQTLLSHGKPPDTPAAIVQNATKGQQRTVEAPLAELPRTAHAAGLRAPALIIIGDVVTLRSRLSWFEQRPLFGKCVLVTRPQHQAADLVRRLEAQGAICLVQPLVEIADPPSWQAVDAVLGRLGEFDWLVFTSVNGVQKFLGRLQACGLDLRALGHLKLAAIGPSTAQALASFHLVADLVPPVYRSEELAAGLREAVAGRRVLLARADRGRDLLRDELAKVASVEQVAVYSQRDVATLEPAIAEALRSGTIDYLTLTSSNIARAFANLLDDAMRVQLCAGRPQIVSISPVTSSVIRELGWPVAAEAKVYTMAGLEDAVMERARAVRTD